MADDNKPDYFDGIRSHFEDLEIKIIEVPEWGLVGDKAIYAKPFNMMEKSKLFKGANSGDLNILIDVIIEKALDMRPVEQPLISDPLFWLMCKAKVMT